MHTTKFAQTVAVATGILGIAGLLLQPLSASAKPAPTPWESTLVSDDSPECLELVQPPEQLVGEDVLRGRNSCEPEKTVTIEVLECSEADCKTPSQTFDCTLHPRGRDCPGPTYEVEFTESDLGIVRENFTDGDTLTVTYGWSFDSGEEGTIEQELTRDVSNSSDGGCGCSNQGLDRPPVELGLFLCGLGLLTLRRRRRRRS